MKTLNYKHALKIYRSMLHPTFNMEFKVKTFSIFNATRQLTIEIFFDSVWKSHSPMHGMHIVISRS